MTGLDQDLAKLFEHIPLLRSRDLEKAGLKRMEISRYVQAGRLKRLRRGLYCLPDYRQNEFGDLAIVAKQMPDALICLLSALRYHELTTQAPSEVWIAISRQSRAPRLEFPSLKVMRFGEAALLHGVMTREIEGVPIHVTSMEKTITDCFKFRSVVGLDVAIEALKEARRRRLIDQNELWVCSKVDRVTNIIRPYLEALA